MPPAKTQSKTYKLIEPVEFAGIEYTELTPPPGLTRA